VQLDVIKAYKTLFGLILGLNIYLEKTVLTSITAIVGSLYDLISGGQERGGKIGQACSMHEREEIRIPHTSPPSVSHFSIKMWEPRRLTKLWASTACSRDSFTLYKKNYDGNP
jgi:hypothetical protein